MIEEDPDLIPAATVLLLRASEKAELEVLMLRRNSKIAFGGMWVFPGGRVDDDEVIAGDSLGSARIAAVREVEEETGLTIDGDGLETWSYWVPPLMPPAPGKGPLKRFSTWFFAVPAPGGEVAIDHGEIHEHRWLTPTAALQQHTDGEIELVPPTWITLRQLQAHDTPAAAMAWAAATEPAEFRTKPLGRDPMTIGWAGDAAYDGATAADGNGEADGRRHRLVLHPDGWDYQRTID